MANDNIISNLSYTNKDFNSIYPELLDLVKKLTNKWDPSMSNESDPGVLLLKLNAIIADKNNYNIDKNVLECFPGSVTQEGNARKLFDSLGYNMNWYNSATNNIGFKALSTENFINNAFTINAFTKLTDSSGEIVYTLLQDVILTDTTTIQNRPCIEGTWQDYEINGTKIITTANLDSDLRLYFPERNVAQNGIYVIDAVSDSDKFYDTNTNWTSVDNIISYPLGNKVFEFGVTPDSNTCYIQFPEDAQALMGEGIKIRYILSSGESGNIKSGVIDRFFENITNEDNKVLNDDIKILQTNISVNGLDPESIESAYKSFKKVIGTFNTLITKRDYDNYIYSLQENNKNVVANVVVNDRTNDLNDTNYIQTWAPGIQTKELVVPDTLHVYDVMLYLYQYADPTSEQNFNLTFKPAQDTPNETPVLTIINDSIENIKAVQQNLKRPEANDSNLFSINNLYTIKGTIITYYKVSKAEAQEIEQNAQYALINAFNSHNLNFGEELDQTKVIEVIENSDSRIKLFVLNDFNYAVNPINTKGEDWIQGESQTKDSFNNNLVARMILRGNVQLFEFDDDFNYDFGQTSVQPIEANEVNLIESLGSELTVTLPTYGTNTNTPNTPYTLKTNEVIRLLAPNLITETEYSIAVKYQLSNNGQPFTIPANTNYQLSGNEQINVTYQNESNLQQTVTLSAGKIINSNIELSNVLTTGSTTSLVDSTTKTLLSGQYIRVKKVNETNLVAGTKYLFITDTTSIDQASGKQVYNLNIGVNESYILRENEYFLYTLGSSNQVVLLGSGTEITNNGITNFSKTSPAVDLNEVDANIDKIDWLVLNAGEALSTKELQIKSFGEGVKIWLGVATSNPITNTTQTLSSDTAGNVLYYQESTMNEPEPIAKILSGASSTTDLNWRIQSRLIINSNPYDPQFLEPTQGTESAITYKQEIQLTMRDSAKTKRLINGGTTGKTIVFNSAFILPGGEEISALSLSLDKSLFEYSLKAYTYIKDNDYTKTRDDLGYIEVLQGTAGTSATLPFTFTKSSKDTAEMWMVPIYVNSKNTDIGEKRLKVTLTTADTNCPPRIYTSKKPEGQEKETNIISSSGSYIAFIKYNTPVSNFTITWENMDSSDSIQVGKIYKVIDYNKDEIESDDYKLSGDNINNIKNIFKIIASIDTLNRFNWVYTVSNDDKVIAPTKASSYWNTNHIYNEHTLSKISFASSSIKVSPSNIN